MIKIESTPVKQVKVHKGTITMVVPHDERTDFEFELHRTTNGVVSDKVLTPLYAEDERLSETIQKTVLINLSKEQITWV